MNLGIGNLSSIFSDKPPRRKALWFARLGITVGVAGFLSLFVMSGTAFAGGGVGSGGGGGGGAVPGGHTPYTSYGWGWTVYPTSGPGPTDGFIKDGFRNPAPWANAQNTCRNARASSVYMLIVLDKYGDGTVYDYKSRWEGFAGRFVVGTPVDHGRATAIDTATARAAFGSLPSYGVDTTGYTFGSNVGWFCYDYAPPPPPPPPPPVTVQANVFMVDASGQQTGVYGGAVLDTCTNPGRITTRPDGFAYMQVPKGTGFCLRVASPPPPGYSGPFVRPWGGQYEYYDTADYTNNIYPRCGSYTNYSGFGGPPLTGHCDQQTYEWQVAGRSDGWRQVWSNPIIWVYDRPSDIGYDFVYVLNLSYTLTPRVSAPAAASRSDTVQFTFTVDNSGPTVTPPTQWWTRGRYILSGQPYDPQPQQDANRGSSGGYREQSGTQVFQVGSSQVFVESVDMSRIPANAAYVCRSLTVYPFDSNQPPRYRTSAEQCVAVGKQPLAQVTGGDLWAGGSFRNSSGSCAAGTGANVKGTAKTYPDGTRAGSWGEYGVFALGSVSAFGSAGFTTDQAPLSSKLTFANTYAGTLGYYFGQAPPIAQYCLSDFWQAAQNMPGPRTTGNETLYDPANLPGGVYTTTATGRVDINTNDRPIPAGTQIVIYAPSAGTVYIKDNIVYQPASYRSPADLPRVIIISGGDIQINHHVDTIDAWLSAAKTLQTCDVGMGEAAESPQCLYPPVSTKPLRFNGPVVATNLKLLRVYGADNNLGANRTTPAELFNLRSDAYLSAYWSSLITGNARTVYQQEAPARY